MGKTGVIFISDDQETDLEVEKKSEAQIEQKLTQAPEVIEKDDKLSSEFINLLKTYEKENKKLATVEEPTIKVGQALSPVAVLYERIRNILDYKGEHLQRRNAIQRIIRRQLWERRARGSLKIATHLIKELIWARYLENNTISEVSMIRVSKVLEKYEILTQFTSSKYSSNRMELNAWRDILLSVASSEIEEILDPSLFYIDAMSDAMFSWFKRHFEWTDVNLSDEEKNLHLWVSIYRSLPKSDNARVRYHLLKKYIQNWDTANLEEVSKISADVLKTLANIESYFTSPIQARLYRFVQRHTAAFQILREVIEKNPCKAKEIFENEESFEKEVSDICAVRYQEIGRIVSTGILRSIIYIFVTKVLVVLLIEVPYEMFISTRVNPIPLLLNLVTPPALMFLVGLTIKKPSEKNTERIINRIRSFVYPSNFGAKIEFSLASVQNKRLIYKVFVMIYALLFLISFGGIAYILHKLNFNIASAMVFFMFMSLVLLFGFRVRYSASELNAGEEREGLLSSLFTNLSLPFLNLGALLSKGLSKLNFLIVVMDFLIEAPLKSILGVVDEWTSFIRERKEEVIEVPGQ
jgi:hypothetical protein